MSTFRQEPYLWLHIAGLAAIPLWGLGVWLGIAAGEPIASYRLEETALVAIGVAPWLWMQWRRPFNPFSLLAVSLPPNVLTDDQRRWLTLLKSRKTQVVALLAILPMVWLLGECYRLAPLAVGATPISNHVLGFGVAAIAFLGANLFMQVSLSMVGLLLLTSEAKFAETMPYDVTQINGDFFRFGLQMRQILPPVARPAVDPSSEIKSLVQDSEVVVPEEAEDPDVAIAASDLAEVSDPTLEEPDEAVVPDVVIDMEGEPIAESTEEESVSKVEDTNA